MIDDRPHGETHDVQRGDVAGCTGVRVRERVDVLRVIHENLEPAPRDLWSATKYGVR